MAINRRMIKLWREWYEKVCGKTFTFVDYVYNDSKNRIQQSQRLSLCSRRDDPSSIYTHNLNECEQKYLIGLWSRRVGAYAQLLKCYCNQINIPQNGDESCDIVNPNASAIYFIIVVQN